MDAVKIFACISIVLGAVECFAGYKTLKIMLAVWSVYIGAVAGTAIGIVSGSVVLGIVITVVLSVLFAVLIYFFHKASIFVLMMIFSAVAAYMLTEVNILSVLIAVIPGLLSIKYTKPTVIINTALSGAAIVITSADIILTNKNLEINILALLLLWIPVALAGVACQYITIQEDSAKSKKVQKQKVYKNYCIMCGSKLLSDMESCPLCNYKK